MEVHDYKGPFIYFGKRREEIGSYTRTYIGIENLSFFIRCITNGTYTARARSKYFFNGGLNE